MESGTESKTGRRGRRWRIVGAVAGVLLVAILLAKYAVIPAVIRSQAQSALAEYWDGTLTIENIDFRFFGPVRLEGVQLLDSSGRSWLEVGDLSLTLRDWPGVHPVLTGVSARKVRLRACFTNGVCTVPLSLPQGGGGSSNGDGYVDLTTLRIQDIILTAVNETPGAAQTHGAFRLARASQPSTQPAAGPRPVWPLAAEEVRIPEIRLADGKLSVGPIESSVGAGGRAKAMLQAKLPRGGPIQYEGKVLAVDVALGDLVARSEPTAKGVQGVLSASYDFSGVGLDPQNMTGRGQIFIDDGDAWHLPVLSDLLRHLHGSGDPLAFSDIDGAFTTRGAVVTVKRFHVGNKLSAIEAVPGGTIHLDDGRLDVRVITAPLKDVRGWLGKVPVVKLFVKAGDTFTRLHVTGRWDVENGAEISKAPTDLVKGTADFFAGAAKTGGDLGRGVGDTLGKFFDAVSP